jgi:hypothetical protein
MAGSRTLKLSILADVDQLRRNLSSGSQEVAGFGDKVTEFGKKAGLAFAAATAAAGAYAIKLAVDGVKAAVEDEAAQTKLAGTLERVTGATNNQIAAVESYITKTSLATGVTDDELRPALSRLIVSVEDTKKSQELLNLALDISAATGKSVESIALALAKAYDGNTTALKKLGIETQNETTVIKDNSAAKDAAERAQLAYNLAIDKYGVSSAQAQKAGLVLTQALEKANEVTTANVKSSLSFDQIIGQLSDKFGGAAAENADTFAGKMARLRIAFDEAKETVGAYLLQALTPVVTYIANTVLPRFDEFANKIITVVSPAIQSITSAVNTYALPGLRTLNDFVSNVLRPTLEAGFGPIINELRNSFREIANSLSLTNSEFQYLKDAIGIIIQVLRTFISLIGQGVADAINIATWFITNLIDNFNRISPVVDSVYAKFRTFVTNVGTLFSTAFQPIVDVFKAAMNTIIGYWNRLDFRISFTVPDWVPVIGGDSWRSADLFPDIPYLAEGGIVTKPTLAMIGEAGPEAVIPLAKAGSMGGDINITVNGAIDPESTARQIIQILNNSAYRGTLGAGALV